MKIPNKYQFVASIGEGSFARVARYKDVSTNQDVAIKRLKEHHLKNEDSIKRFRREIDLLKRLRDVRGVIDLLDVIDAENELAYVMSCGITNLYEYIKKNNNNLLIEYRIAIYDIILHTIKEAHNRGILHRDISPRNIIVFASDGVVDVKVCDFGIGKSADMLTGYTNTSVNGFGQIYYVAPEQNESLKQATMQSDVYALGKLLNFVITGKDPNRHHNCKFSVVISKSINEEPRDRYQSVSEFEKTYEEIKLLIYGNTESSGNLAIDNLEFNNTMNWHSFHGLVTNPRFDGHVYYGYIQPVVAYLLNDNYLEQYYNAVGSEIVQFVNQFIESIDQCIGSVGWPFSATDSFGMMLNRIFGVATEPEIKLICLNKMWDIAYRSDQWAVQDMVKEHLKGGVPDEILISFAYFIRESNISISRDQFQGISIQKELLSAIFR